MYLLIFWLIELKCLSQLSSVSKTEVIFATSYIHLDESVKICNGNLNTYIAAQDCSSKSHGAFTGEVSAKMIKSCGARYVVLGHSERRLYHSETNNLLCSSSVSVSGYWCTS